jgi:type IV pilus assembly protein PilA
MTAATHEFLPEEVMALQECQLSPERAAALSRHLETCAECSTLAAELRGLSQQISTWQVELIPARLADRVTAVAKEKATNGVFSVRRVLKQRRSPALKWTVRIAAGSAVLLLLLAISIPNLMRSRMAANEASAVGSLRTLNTAAATYSATYGHFPPSLRSFGPPRHGNATEEAADLVDPVLASGRKSGYLFAYHTTAEGRDFPGGYEINADPMQPGSGGLRHFSTDQTGVIRADGQEIFGGSSLEKDSNQDNRASRGQENVRPFTATAPMIARTAELKVAVVKLDEARTAMDRILEQHKGYVAQLSASAESGSTRTLAASLRVPADQLDLCIAELKKLGRVTHESQAGQEVTQQHMDLVARLKNSRNTEARLNEVIHQHTGKVADVLEVEKESARVRGEIEQMEAEQKTLEHRVDFATIDLKLAEEYKAQLSSPAPSVATQFRNASVNGFRNAFESLMTLILFLAESGPTLILWALLLGFPAWILWRRYRRSFAMSSIGA